MRINTHITSHTRLFMSPVYVRYAVLQHFNDYILTLLSQPVVSEEALVARLQAKDCAAFTLLYDNYSAVAYGIALRIVGCEQCAEDVTQETFVKVWRAFPSYDSTKGRLFTWLLNIARRTAIDMARTPHRRNGRFTQGIDKDSSCLNHVACSFNSECMDIGKLTSALKPEQKQVIDLMYFGGYTQSETAEKLDLPLGTVKTRARSAIITLKGFFTSST